MTQDIENKNWTMQLGIQDNYETLEENTWHETTISNSFCKDKRLGKKLNYSLKIPKIEKIEPESENDLGLQIDGNVRQFLKYKARSNTKKTETDQPARY